jgi:hypothetical protein
MTSEEAIVTMQGAIPGAKQIMFSSLDKGVKKVKSEGEK